MAVFYRARAAVMEACMDEGAAVAPSFAWRKPVQLRRKRAD
ncbi:MULTISPECIES: hypothetical protein [Citrobacter]|nr:MULTISPECIES: hypothetical protein [Citrobacter]MDM3091573.1 hypothetical protein [Citrobacter sp. Cf136]MDT7420177.1 hypothetical protein [Citrobacter freundii]